MTFTQYYWTIFGTAFAIYTIGMTLAKALWPWLKRNRWVLHDWED